MRRTWSEVAATAQLTQRLHPEYIRSNKMGTEACSSEKKTPFLPIQNK